MDQSIICECGNCKFLVFSNFSRCPECLNEYVSDFNGEDWEYSMRKFNKEEGSYSENWEYFNPTSSVGRELFKVLGGRYLTEGQLVQAEVVFNESFQQISDKGIESISKDESIIDNAISIQELVKLDKELRKNPAYGETCVKLRKTEKNFLSKDDSIVENAVKSTIGQKRENLFQYSLINEDARWIYNYHLNIEHALKNNQELGNTDWYFKKFWNDRAKFEEITRLKNHIRFIENWKR